MERNAKFQWIFCLLLGCATSLVAQNVANWGLTHPQPKETLPKSKAQIMMSTPKAQTPVEAVVEKVGENDFLLNWGWKLTDGKNGWYNATIPGTVLTTLVDQGVYPDPYYGLNNLAIPDTLCRMDWWYRLEFNSPVPTEGREAWLVFKGINYQAEIWLNDVCLGAMKGAFIRGEFNATDHLVDGKNTLVVRILPPPNPGIPHEQSPSAGNGMNGGQLCLDGPTFISSEGWDWVPGIRDRNIGIWQDVHLRFTNGIRLHDTQVVTHLALPDTTVAEVTVRTEVENLQPIARRVSVDLNLEGKKVTQEVNLAPKERKTVVFTPDAHKALELKSPRLWWPNNYGRQELYTMDVVVAEQGVPSDSKKVRFGVRELSYELEVCFPDDSIRRVEYRPTVMGQGEPIFDNINRKYIEGGMCMPRLKKNVSSDILVPAPDKAMQHYMVIKVNGRRIFCKGGNWGMDDAMKRVSREHLEPYFRLHKEANFNMIRNWTGESTEESFYELCDEYGMLVFNDFWLSTQGYNMPVNDDNLFLRNAEDVVVRFRNHPSIAVWNPRNEGFAPVYIEEHLAKMIAEKDGTRYYSPNSTHCNLRPSGPWNYHKNPVDYYRDRAHGFNTEQGSTSIPTEESILAMMDVKDAWPISDVWYYHDLHGGQREFMEAIDQKYGKPMDLKDFSRKAQIVNYDSHRAMMEAWNSKMWNSTSGLLLWMSHPAWPSMVWQIYSWDYETFGSFYGCRKACEPIHIQKNLDDQKVVVVNTSLKEIKGAKVIYEVYSLGGKSLFKRTSRLNVLANGLTECFVQDKPVAVSGVYMERLILQDKRGKLISINDYWQDNGEGNFEGFNALEEASINCKLIWQKENRIQIELQNTGVMPALALKLNVREADTDKRILPAYASDGYFNLLPGEKRTVTVEYVSRGKVAISAEGYNLKRSRLLTLK
ncbi:MULTISPECIES: glycoside hydrolase family 2 TIM barrel-domain containing protein [Bacteroides]|jgi:hypothetical protein|uniref:glycoside hydrolase family 2 protein n=1 Tax=Bacteroides TaxID=816 RepID=UPI000E49909B|nr:MULTISPECIES: glycoside hydrolase family 2 TIM barrel-domain containing protein [Bacteroides]RHL12822.1 glycoside hydrolase family 2 [Bacteroides sp. AF39-11AC]